jgi:hypothetical protein
MKLSKKACLILGILFSAEFIYSLFDKGKTHELFIWEVNIWIYRLYRLALPLMFAKLYFERKNAESLNNQ